MSRGKSRQGWCVQLAALIVFAVTSVPAAAQAFTAWADGNTIYVTIGAGLEGDRCCRGASIDLPGGGGQCSVACPANAEITQPFGCNSVGTHTVYGCVLDKNTNYQYVCSQQTVTVTEPPAPTCPQFQLITPGTKTLTHKFGDAFGTAATYPPGQTTDGELPFKILVKNTPPGGASITLKVADPPDTSAYGAPHQKDDNIDSAGGTINGAKTTTITLPEHGIVDVVLKTSLQKGGDNYVVMASGNPGLTNDPNFVCSADTKCEQTPVITSWKRLYVEMNEMYRNSQIMVTDVLPGSRLVYVNENYRRGDRIRLIHAPSYLRNKDNDALGFYSEDFVVANSRRNGNPAIDAAYEIELNAPVTKPYLTDIVIGGIRLGDAIANLSRIPRGSSGPTYPINETYVYAAFRDAFVEVVKAPGSGIALPLYEQMTQNNMIFVGGKWFSARTAPLLPSNVGFACAGATRANLNGMPDALSLGTTAGLYSYVWQQNIERATSGTRKNFPLLSGHDPIKTGGEVLVHELAHQWNVNPGTPDRECTRNAYDDPAKFCTMNSPENSAQYDDDVVKFHYVGTDPATADSEYMTIRRADDPRP